MNVNQLMPPRPGRPLDIFNKVDEFIRRSSCLRNGENLLVAVSGGADSTALALILSSLRKTVGLQLTLAHFDHRLRSREEAAADLMFVQALASRMNAPLVLGNGDVREHSSKSGLSVEDAGRRLRYAFLRDQSLSSGATVVALGHTASDQAETVLFRIIRGTGIEGLRAMLPRSGWPFEEDGPDLARPLLSIERGDTEFYCGELGFVPVDDASNKVLDTSRNRIRHQILPMLRRLNPRVDDALVRLARSAESTADYVARQASAVWPAIAIEGVDQITFIRSQFDGLEPALQARLLTVAFRRLAGGRGEIEATHIDRALGLVASKITWRMSLPAGVRLAASASHIGVVIGKEPPALAIEETRLAVPGRTQLAGWIVDIQCVPPPPTARPGDPLEAFLDAASAGRFLTVRSRRRGDRLRPLGLGGEKKVQDILVDARVPVSQRDGVPIVCGETGIAWVVGHRLDENYSLCATSKKAFHVQFTRRDS